MTKLLEKAFEEASRLPEMEPNCILKGRGQKLSLIRKMSWRSSPMRPLQRDEKARLLRSI
jgi:hypothetical protein